MTRRNDPCPCGSNLKYKKCCGLNDTEEISSPQLSHHSQGSAGHDPSFGPAKQNEIPLPQRGEQQNSPQYHYEKACSYIENNMLHEAAESFKRALALQAAPEVYYNLATIQERLGAIEDAIESLLQSLELNPGFKEAQTLLGDLFLRTNNFPKAATYYKLALSNNPDARIYNNLGVACREMDMLEEAGIHFRKALKIKEDFDEAYVNLGVTLHQGNKPEEAIKLYKKALERNPSLDQAYHNLGVLYREKGDFAEAIAALQKALEINPNRAEYHSILATIQKYSGNEKHIQEMETLFTAHKLNDSQQMLLAFGLAKAYEDAGQFEKSFGYSLEGNRLKRKTVEYSTEKMEKIFDHNIKVFNKSFVAKEVEAAEASDRPIFILGMPRSGTTLVEQILASHSEVHGGNELPYLGQIAKQISKTGGDSHALLDYISRHRESFAAEVGKQYLEKISKLSSSKKYITDKMPENFFNIGMIHLALPNAKIIHCVREPMDNCLSIFKHRFEGDLPYAYNLEELGHFYLIYEKLMQHWHDVLPPGKIYDISYEKLVGNQEEETRKLLQYCELPWEDSCLTFHKTSRSVKTASAVQVRKPIYKSSVHLWKKYGKLLEPLHNILTDNIP